MQSSLLWIQSPVTSGEGKGLTHHVPNTWHPNIAPYTPYLPFRVQAPDRLEPCANFWPQYFAQWGPRIAIAAHRKPGNQKLLREKGTESYPVAKMTASASRVLPSVNSSPFCVKRAIWASFLSLILPSTINWLAPTSVPRVDGFVE